MFIWPTNYKSYLFIAGEVICSREFEFVLKNWIFNGEIGALLQSMITEQRMKVAIKNFIFNLTTFQNQYENSTDWYFENQ